jgi:predicted alpha-1,2-mannosidase
VRSLVLGAVLSLLAPADAAPAEPGLSRFVDPRIGTGGHGHTFPGPTLPFGMVQLSPDTRLTGWDGCSGYHDSDRVVYGFSHTHLSGTGASDYGDILLLPFTGPVRLTSSYEKEPGSGYGSRFRKETESAGAGYYSVALDDYGVTAELTATARVGLHRYAFPAGEARVLVDLTHRDTVIESWLRVVDETTLEGMRRSKRWAKDQPVYFVARFSRPFTAQVFADDRPVAGTGANGANVKAVLGWHTAAADRLVVKVAISAVDVEGARRNLDAEVPGFDFDGARAAARAAWDEALQRIEIEGGSEAQRRTFYTALYHALLQPNLFQDVDGRFLGRDGQVHSASGYTRYTVFSLWDTFRAAHPLYALLERGRTRDFVRTFLEQYREAGRLPVWELWGNETDTMIGYHAVPVIADAWIKGIRGFDAALALEAMKASANADLFGLPEYRKHGYVPAEAESESVSKTLEYAYDDWTIATFARAIGREGDAREFARRAQGWTHLLDPQGFMRARRNGGFVAPFDPFEVNNNYTEANAWQYSFFVPHDVDGLAARLGGPRGLERRLDALFAAPSETTGRRQSDITGLIGQYVHGNEPSHHMAYLYAYAGAPAKTQAMVRRILDEQYSDRPDGLAGNEDCGQMSAWYVLSALGFYPVTPGTADYVVGAPLFERAQVRFEDGRSFTIRARNGGPGRPYVQSASLNGRPYSRSFLTHDALVAGGELVFEMGAAPSAWGSGENDRPRTPPAGPRVVPAPVAEGPELAPGPAMVTLRPADPADRVVYALDGTAPGAGSTPYSAPLRLDPPATVSFRSSRGGEWSPVVTRTLRRLDPSRKLVLRTPYSPQYAAGGDMALIDGLRGGPDFRLGTWQGYEGRDLVAEIDLGAPQAIRRLAAGFLQDAGSWIFLPLEVRFELSSDGVTWRDAGRAPSPAVERDERALTHDFAVSTGGALARFVRVTARAPGPCPAGHEGAGQPCWIFADEIVVE